VIPMADHYYQKQMSSLKINSQHASINLHYPV